MQMLERASRSMGMAVDSRHLSDARQLQGKWGGNATKVKISNIKIFNSLSLDDLDKIAFWEKHQNHMTAKWGYRKRHASSPR